MARPTTKVSKVRVAGPLAPFATEFEARLRQSGYTPLTRVAQLRLMSHLSRWLEARNLTVTDLTRQRVEEYVATRRGTADTPVCWRQGLAALLEALNACGVLPTDETPTPRTATDVLLASFRRHLLEERGLATSTTAAYVHRAHRFLAWCAADGDLTELTTSDVTSAVLREAATVSTGSTQYFVAALRSFLRFCFVEGLIEVDLSAAVSAVTGRRYSPLPNGISPTDAAALLRSCDRRRSDGRRDYAVLLTLLRLGLRASEVAALTLDDIDWRAGEIIVHGKGRRVDRLPLPADVGEAIAGYLQRGRPKATHRNVFLRALAPIGPLGRGGVSCIVRRACERAGLTPMGSHRLRHALACRMVEAGVGLAAIGDVLRQRSLASTAIYARVGVDQLRGLAQPWPGSVSQ